MSIMLNNSMLTTIRKIISSRAPTEIALAEEVASGTIGKAGLQQILKYVADELCEHGFDAESEPTAYGLELERLIDELNRPNLK